MKRQSNSNTFMIYLIILAELFPGILMSSERGIKITDIFVPKVKLVGEDAELVCKFVRPNGVKVYSIKWWRNNDQFYQYIPRNDPPKLPFNVSGIVVDPQMSSEFSVVLRGVTVETTGLFTCEVMADESFETVRESDNMTVIDPPDGVGPDNHGPFIELSGSGIVNPGPIKLRPGRILEALCVAKRTYPKANLSWLVNDKQASAEHLNRIQPRQEGRYSFTSQLWLTLTVSDDHFNENGILILVCNATLGDHYHSHATLILKNPLRVRARNSGLFSAGFSINSSVRILTATVFSVFSVEIIYKSCLKNIIILSLLCFVFNILSSLGESNFDISR